MKSSLSKSPQVYLQRLTSIGKFSPFMRRMLLAFCILSVTLLGAAVLVLRAVQSDQPSAFKEAMLLATSIASQLSSSDDVRHSTAAYMPGEGILIFSDTMLDEQAAVRSWAHSQLANVGDRFADLDGSEQLIWIITYGDGAQEMLAVPLNQGGTPSQFEYVSGIATSFTNTAHAESESVAATAASAEPMATEPEAAAETESAEGVAPVEEVAAASAASIAEASVEDVVVEPVTVPNMEGGVNGSGVAAFVSAEETAERTQAALDALGIDESVEGITTVLIGSNTTEETETPIALAFETGGNLEEWHSLDGAWLASSLGIQQTQINQYDRVNAYRQPLGEDYTVKATVRHISGEMGGGIAFGLQSLSSKTQYNMLSYTADGTFLQWGYFDENGVFQYQNGIFVEPGNDGDAHVVEVRVRNGNTFDIVLDDVVLFQGERLAYSGGYAGLYDSLSHVIFEQFVIEIPE